jgi:hypothetical protein
MESSSTNPTAANAPNADQNKQTVLKDICAKWSKFSEQDASALKSNDDLVTQVVAKYGTEQTQAKREVDALMKGRHIGAAN